MERLIPMIVRGGTPYEYSKLSAILVKSAHAT